MKKGTWVGRGKLALMQQVRFGGGTWYGVPLIGNRLHPRQGSISLARPPWLWYSVSVRVVLQGSSAWPCHG